MRRVFWKLKLMLMMSFFLGCSVSASAFITHYNIDLGNGYELWYEGQQSFKIRYDPLHNNLLEIAPTKDGIQLIGYSVLPEVIVLKAKVTPTDRESTVKVEHKYFLINISAIEASEALTETEFEKQLIEINNDGDLMWVAPENPYPRKELILRLFLWTIQWRMYVFPTIFIVVIIFFWRISLKGKKGTLMSIELQEPEVHFALHAACAAGHLAQTIQASMTVTGVEKKDLSPVTVADFSCQAIVAQALCTQFPEAVLVGEEDSGLLKEDGQSEVLQLVTDYVQQVLPQANPETVCDWIDAGNGQACDRFWTLDPIDGTKGYLRGEQYAVALALIENGQVILGVLACPNLGMDASSEVAETGTLLIAQRGKGCWRAPMNAPEKLEQIHVSDCSSIEKARLLRSVESGHTNTGTMGTLVEAMNIEAPPVCLDSQAKYAVLACGGGEALLRLLSSSRPDYREMIWDQAAGSIVIEEAGGRISDLSGKALDFGQGSTLAKNRGVCASNGLLHDTLLKALAEHA